MVVGSCKYIYLMCKGPAGSDNTDERFSKILFVRVPNSSKVKNVLLVTAQQCCVSLYAHDVLLCMEAAEIWDLGASGELDYIGRAVLSDFIYFVLVLFNILNQGFSEMFLWTTG